MNVCLRLRWQLLPKTVVSLPCRSAVSESEIGEKKTRPTSWRIPFSEREDEWHSSFSYFTAKNSRPSPFIEFIRRDIDLRPSTIKTWWRRRKEEMEIFNQRFIPERHETLGNDLAAAHFLIYRGGAVRFRGREEWTVEKHREQIPRKRDPSYSVEAIDASGMTLYYEGLDNLRSLRNLKWLSFKNSLQCNDWFLDFVSGEYCSSLEYLDISNCKNVTENGLAALYRLQHLKLLKVNDIPQSRMFEFTCFLLEDLHKGLTVEGVKYIEV